MAETIVDVESGVETLSNPAIDTAKERISNFLQCFYANNSDEFVEKEILDPLLWAASGNTPDTNSITAMKSIKYTGQLYWSLEAIKACNAKKKGVRLDTILTHEHIVPRNVLKSWIRRLNPNYADILNFLKIYAHVFIITNVEDGILPRMDNPDEWRLEPGCDIFARYRNTNIKIQKVNWNNDSIPRVICPQDYEQLVSVVSRIIMF